MEKRRKLNVELIKFLIGVGGIIEPTEKKLDFTQCH